MNSIEEILNLSVSMVIYNLLKGKTLILTFLIHTEISYDINTIFSRKVKYFNACLALSAAVFMQQYEILFRVTYFRNFPRAALVSISIIQIELDE